MSGRALVKLPYDAEIEYLEVGAGVGAYIDTGIKIKSSLRHKSQFYGDSSTTGAFYGGRISANDGVYMLKNSTTNNYCFNYHNYNSSSFSFSSAIHTESFIGQTYTFDNRQFTVQSKSFNTELNFYIFKGNGYASPSTVKRFYYFQLYDGNILVRDYIPVRVGNVGYMYDKVSGQLFGNAGTGSFILGNDI